MKSQFPRTPVHREGELHRRAAEVVDRRSRLEQAPILESRTAIEGDCARVLRPTNRKMVWTGKVVVGGEELAIPPIETVLPKLAEHE